MFSPPSVVSGLVNYTKTTDDPFPFLIIDAFRGRDTPARLDLPGKGGKPFVQPATRRVTRYV